MARSTTIRARIEATDRASGKIKKVERGFSGLASKIKTGYVVGLAAATAAVAAFTRVLGSSVDAAAKQEAAVNKAASAMQTAGTFSKSALKEVEGFASALQKVSTVGDETALELFALARGFTSTNQAAQDIVRTSADFAKAADIGMTEAVRRLGRAVHGSTEDVAKFAPEIANLTKTQLQAGEATKILGQRFAGLAAAELRTFDGRLQQLKNSFGDLLESFGSWITKSETARVVMEGLTRAFDDLAKAAAAGPYKEHADKIAALTSRYERTEEAQRKNTTAINDSVESFGVLSGVINGVLGRYDEDVRYTTQLIELRKKIREAQDDYTAAVQRNTNATTENTNAQKAAIARAAEAIGLLVDESLLVEFRKLDEALGVLEAQKDKSTDGWLDYLEAQKKVQAEKARLRKAFEDAEGSLSSWRENMVRAKDATSDLSSGVNSATDSVRDLGRELPTTVNGFDRLTEGAERTKRKLKEVQTQTKLTSLEFDRMVNSQGYQQAVNAAVSSGAIIRGNRVILNHGSRFVTPPGFGFAGNRPSSGLYGNRPGPSPPVTHRF